MSQKENKRPSPGNGGGRGPGGPGGGPGGHHGMSAGEKAKDFKGAIKRLLSYMGRYKPALIFVMIMAAAGTLLGTFGPKILAGATDLLVDGIKALAAGTGTIDFDGMLKILLFLMGLYLVSAALSYLRSFVMTGVSNKIVYKLRQDISKKFHVLPLKYFESTSPGDILSRVTNDVDIIATNMGSSLTQLISSATTLIAVLVMMLSISPLMTLVAILVVPFSGIFTLNIVRRSQKYFVDQQAYLGEVNGKTEESYGGQVVIKAFNAEEKTVADFNEKNQKLYKSAWKSQFFSGLVMPAVNFIGNIGYVITCVLGAYLAGKGSITLGDIQAFIQYVRQFNQPISQFANITTSLQQLAAAAERVFEFLGEEEEIAEPANPVSVIEKDGETLLSYTDDSGEQCERPFYGNVEFCNVTFGYDSDKPVIKNFSAFIEAGQKIAIVGHTGAGKTTIVKLLMRFYDVNDGSILIDGIDIRRFSRHSLRSLFGMVLQDSWLYNASIMDNIRYGRINAPDDEVIAAAKTAGADHFIRTLPMGYGVLIDEEGDNISSGQKQLLTIARAVLKDPSVLILDEATSNVDTKTEADIQRAMAALMGGRTSFIIAHRLSTIKDCDLILMMEDGDIIEQGSHNALLLQGGAYASLWNSQFDMAM